MKNFSYKLFFHALNNEGRLAIVQLLKNGSKSVKEISKELGIEQSLVSHNLRCLTDCGFVNTKKEGNFRIYSIENETVIPILNSIDKHIEKFEEHLKTCGIINTKEVLVRGKI